MHGTTVKKIKKRIILIIIAYFVPWDIHSLLDEDQSGLVYGDVYDGNYLRYRRSFLPPFSFYIQRLSNPHVLECLATAEVFKAKAQKYFINAK